MKRLLFLALACSLHAATYYVASSTSTPAGNDANPGTIGAPWLTIAHAAATMACGDTVNIVADGKYIAGDADFPGLDCSSSLIHFQSAQLASFQPVSHTAGVLGYRTNPAVDCTSPGNTAACLYGKLQFTATGITMGPESHGSAVNAYGYCGISSIASNIITLSGGSCGTIMPNLANNSSVELEIDLVNNPSATTMPTGITLMMHYYVKNCSAGCGTDTSTLQLSTTPGGAAMSLGTCSGTCDLTTIVIDEPLQFTAGSATITSPDAFGSKISNGTPVALSSVGVEIFGSLPTGFSRDTNYYVCSLSGRTFQLSTNIGCTGIVTPSDVGVGPSNLANTNVPKGFVFDGIEFAMATSATTCCLLNLGSSAQTSSIGAVNNVEVSRSYFHDVPTDPNGPIHAIIDDGSNLNIHDNYIAGVRSSGQEAQTISGSGVFGPVYITNNFLESSTECILHGGSWNLSGVSNQNIYINHNYCYKPPTWYISSAAGAPTVGVSPCWYDATDPILPGGQWYTDTNTSIKYQCDSGGHWATTASTVPTANIVKNTFESKSCNGCTYTGNIINYSWANNQAGQAFSFAQNYDSGPAAANSNITIQNNMAMHNYDFITAGSACTASSGTFPCKSVSGSYNYPSTHTVQNNIDFEDPLACGLSFTVTPARCGASLYNFTWGGYPENGLIWNHNTVIGPAAAAIPDGNFGYWSFLSFSGCTTPNGKDNGWLWENSIGAYDIQGDCTNGSGTISAYVQNSTFTNFAMVDHNAGIPYGSPGATNTLANFVTPASNATMQYVDLANFDAHLAPTSPYSAANASAARLSTDGTDLGADIDALNAAISGAVAGTPTWAVQEKFVISPTSTGAAVTYTRPGTTACSLTIYNAPARISANENADTNSSGNKLDTRAGNTLVGANVTFNVGTVSPLTPSTQYWYSLSCVAADVSTWLLAGDSFTTLSSGGGSHGGSIISGHAVVGGSVVIH